MKHRKLFFLVILIGVLIWPLFSKCGSSSAVHGETKDVPYFEAVNYFYVGDDVALANPKICTDARFDSLFDTASHINEKNYPTPIDFSRQFVIAVVLPPTNRRQSVRLRHLRECGNELTLSYKLINGPVCSRKTQSIALVLVDRRYVSRKVVVVRE